MSTRLVVVGGNPGGMAAISQARKGQPDLEVVALEMGAWTSYAACGIPFVVGGLIPDIDQLVARTPEQHRRAGTDVRLHHEAVALDIDAQCLEVRDHNAATTYRLDYDQLLLATGGRPVRPPLPGIDLPFVVGVQTLDDGARLVEIAQRAGCRRVVVVGAGYIGLEIAEAFCHRGCTSIVVDQASQPMITVDPEIGAIVADALERHGIEFRAGVQVQGFEPGRVLTDQGPIDADLVVLGIGTLPRADLGANAGLTTGVKGAITVDDHQRTSADGIWAAGDCAASTHLVTGEQVHMALGTYANRQARVAGINIGGGDARFPGVLGTAVTRLCDLEIGRTGLSSVEAARAGLSVVTSTIESTTRAGYYPGAEPLTLRLISEQGSGRVVGGQIAGGQGAAKRVDVVATAITAGMTVDDLVDLDLGYAPPFGGVWDPVAVAARTAVSARTSSADASR